MSTWSGLYDVKASLRKASALQHLVHVPLVRQPDTYSCGTASVLSVLGYYGIEFGYEDLSKALKASKSDGIDHRNIIKFFQDKGLEVELHKGMLLSDLQSFIDDEVPVIVVIQAWNGSLEPVNYENEWDSGHYAVVVGYDDDNIILMDPSTLGNYTYIPRDEFVKRWHDQDQDIKLRQAGIVVTAIKRYDPDELKKIK